MLNGGGDIVAWLTAGEQSEDMVVTVGAVDGDKKSSTLALKKQRRW
jgi:hypothetical protein